MKTFSTVVVTLLLCSASRAATQPIPGQPAPDPTLPPPTAYHVTERAADHRIWQCETYEVGPRGQVVTQVHKYTELSSGMYYKNVNGDWTESRELIESFPGGAIARQGQYQVIFANNLNSAGAIDLQAADGKRLVSNILGLAYYDNSTGQSVLIAQIQDSQGELIADNQVLYRNSFKGVKADVRYTYKRGSFEQDVILREQPPTPESFGLNSVTTEIEVMTEFINPPQASIAAINSGNQGGELDEQISWGTTSLGHGKAFDLTGKDAFSQPSLRKQYITVQGRNILLEIVPLKNIHPQLAHLPLQSSITSRLPVIASKVPLIPKAPSAPDAVKPMKLASALPSNKGYVLDYIELNTSHTNFTFQGDMTYLVDGTFNLTGVTTFEGGTVVKANVNGQIDIDSAGTVNCQTGPYRPAIFTSINDNSIGESVSGSSGSPSVSDVNVFLVINCPGAVLSNFRMNYGTTCIVQYGNLDLWNCQFVPVDLIVAGGGNVGLHNVLLQEVWTDTPVQVDYAYAENVTADGELNLGVNTQTNCIEVYGEAGENAGVAFTPGGGASVYVNGVYSATPSVSIFQTVGGANFYLATNSPYRNVGTTNISPALLAGLHQKTTYPPVVYAGTTLSAATTLSPQAQRNTNAPDLGYHYDPLDYVFGGCSLYTNLTLIAGTAIGWYEDYGSVYASGQPYGISLNDGANITFAGTVTQPCWVTRFDVVQESVNGNWGTHGWMSGLVFTGSGSGAIPQINAQFAKWSNLDAFGGYFRDNWAYGVAYVSNSEFYNSGFGTYRPSMYLTNCLFDRAGIACWDQSDAPNLTFENCSFYNGLLVMCRYSGQSSSFWMVKNTAFDGTAFAWADNFNGDTNHTAFDYNSYNTNNLSWQTYPYPYPPTYGNLESVGAHDMMVANFNWQTSWLGNFYLSPTSPLINAGLGTADQWGLYHFTTQTNQVKETNSIVDIGYHYVATDAYGNPMDSNGNGIPDYIEDRNGTGIMGPLISLISPVSSTFYVDPATISLLASATDWSGAITNVQFLQNSNNLTSVTSTPYQFTWPIVPHGQYWLTAIARDANGLSSTSAPVMVSVTNLCGSY